MNCPDCNTYLSRDAKSCRCGWESAPKLKTHPLGYPQCEWESDGVRCKYPGTLSSGAQFFCSPHFGCADGHAGAAIVEASRAYQHKGQDVRAMNIEAARYCRENGLETVEQMRAFCREKVRNIVRRKAA